MRQRIEEVYAKEGFDSISDDDLHGRFRWWGLYTQRRPGIDGGRTAQLETSELEDSYFMMRVRTDGGAMTTEQLRVVAGISTELARDTADISDRQNIQYHWIRVEDVPEIWRRLESVGLGTTEACGDCPRVILGSPLAGVAANEIIDPTPVIEEIQRRFIGDPELANLPRKFKSAITGHPSLDVVHEINDISLVGVVHPELGPGYDLWVGGGLSTSARLAERLGAFVTEDQAADVWHAVVQIFRDYGFRRLRNKARLKFLNTGSGQNPVVLAATLDGNGYAGAGFKRIVYLFNVDKATQTLTVPGEVGQALQLHPVHRAAGAADLPRRYDTILTFEQLDAWIARLRAAGLRAADWPDAGDDAHRLGHQRDSGEDRRGLAVAHVEGGRAAPQVGVVHRRQVVDQKRRGMHHLAGRGRFQHGVAGGALGAQDVARQDHQRAAKALALRVQRLRQHMAQARPAAPQVLRQLLQPRDQPRARRHRRSRRVLRNVLAVAHRPPCPLFPAKVVPHA